MGMGSHTRNSYENGKTLGGLLGKQPKSEGPKALNQCDNSSGECTTDVA